MSLKFGLGNSKDDIEIQGEIDYDFFEDGSSKFADDSGNWTPDNKTADERGIVPTVTDNKPSYAYPSSSTVYSTSEVVHNQVNEQAFIGDSLLVSLNCKSSSDTPFFGSSAKIGLESGDALISGQISGNVSIAAGDISTCLNTKPVGQEVPTQECTETKSKYPKKIIETVIPNLEECPQYPVAVVTNFVSPDEENGERKEENSGSLSSSMTDSDDTSSLSEESFDVLSESESITDVTPLHSPYCCDSPVSQIRSSEGMQPKEDSEQFKEMDCSEGEQSKKKDSVQFSDEFGWCEEGASEPVDLNALVAAIRRLEIQQGHRATKQRNCITPPLVHPRKNMSFSNEEVRRIDQENQRLLKKILAQQTRSKPVPSQTRASHISSSQVNRHRQQRQAEIENIALLKRIESAKPSRELSRVKLLRDYNRLSPSLTSIRSQSRPSTAASSLHAAGSRSGRSHSLPSSSESSTSVTPSASQERPKTAQALHAASRLQKQRSLH